MINKFIHEQQVMEQMEQANRNAMKRLMLEVKGEVAEMHRHFVLLVLDEPYRSFFYRWPSYRKRSCLIDLHKTDSFHKFHSLAVPVLQLRPDDTHDSILERRRHFATGDIDDLPKCRSYRCVLVEITPSELTKRWFVSEIVFSILRRMLYFVGVKEFHKDFYAIFSDWDERYVSHSPSEKYLVLGGIGDSLINVPALFYLQRHCGPDRKIVSYHETKITTGAINFFTQSARVNDFAAVMAFADANKNVIKEKLRDYRFIEPPEEPNKSYFECANAMYPIDADSEEIFRFFRQNYILPHSNRLEALKHRHRYVIGFQRCSGTKIEQKKCKELPVAMAREFVELCRAQDIAVVNLEPADEHKYLYDNDISGLKLSELYPVMTELDAVVGVDSCFGHAAALLNVPSVTVFVTTYLRFRYIQKFFMPLSRNYSLYPVDYTTVHCEKIFQILMDVLTGRLQLSEEFIPMSQRREYQHYEYV